MACVIHPTALVDASAELGLDVHVGPFCVVGEGVSLGDGTVLVAHVVLQGPLAMGVAGEIYPFAVLGGRAQVRREDPEPGSLLLGDRVVVREQVTVHRGTEGHATRVGSDVLLMAGAHVGHDASIGSHVVISNAVQIAGHVTVEEHVTFGGLSGVAQWLRIGEGSFVAAGAMCEVDVPPFVIVQGDRARVRALNKVGLARRGVPEASILALEEAYRRLFVRKELPRRAAAEALAAVDDPYVQKLRAAVLRVSA